MSKPIRSVLALAGRVRVSSGALHMLDLLAGLRASGINVSLLCGGLDPELVERDIAVPVIHWRQVAGRLAALRNDDTFQKTFTHPPPEVIHIHGRRLGWSGRRFLRHFRTASVLTPHFGRNDLGDIGRMQKRCARVIALNQSMREMLVNQGRVPREKVAVVGMAIEMRPAAASPPGAKRVPVVCTVAPLRSDQGQRLFLAAAREILDAGRRAEFVIGGDGPDEKALRRRASKLGLNGHVTFVTRLPVYSDVIAAADVFVRPALVGGVGYSVLEAMAMSKAVVASATAGIVEIVDDGASGFLVMKNDAAALAEAVGKLVDEPDLARRMGVAGRQRAAAHFGIGRLVENMLEVYAQAVASHGG